MADPRVTSPKMSKRQLIEDQKQTRARVAALERKLEQLQTRAVAASHRPHPVDVMEEVLRQHLGTTKEATPVALGCWDALRRAGWLGEV